MKKVHIRFEQDASLDHIDVVIRAPDQDDSVTDLINRISARPPDMLTAYDENGNVRKLDQKKIVLASVNGKVVDLITDDGIWHIRQTLQNLEDNLDKQRFVRISRYEIVNVEKILKYDFTVAGTLRIELTGGMETWASRRCIPAIRRRLTGKGGGVMKRKILIRGLIGFATGVAMMFFVPAFINQAPLDRVIYTEGFLRRVGNNETAAVLLTLLVMGMFGACCFWGTLFYEIERWPLALATIAHYLLISAGYLIPNWLLCWNMPVKLLVTIEVIMMIGFFIIWLIIYCVYKREVNELNQLQKQMRNRNNEEKE